MALSIILRSASSALKGCPNALLTQQTSRLSILSSQNISKMGMLNSFQSNNRSFERSSKLQTPVVKINYSSAAPAQAAGSHSTIWVAERALSVGLVGLVPLAIACPSKPLDVLLAVSMVAHTYWGFEAVIQDYVRELLFGSLVPKVAHMALIVIMVATLGGLFYLIFNDIGLANTIRKFWSVRSKNQVAN